MSASLVRSGKPIRFLTILTGNFNNIGTQQNCLINFDDIQNKIQMDICYLVTKVNLSKWKISGGKELLYRMDQIDIYDEQFVKMLELAKIIIVKMKNRNGKF